MRVSCAFIFFIFSVAIFGQDVTIINTYPGQRPSDPEDFVLSKVTQHTYVVNEYAALESGQRAQALQMISYGLRAYIDQSYATSKGRVKANETPQSFMSASSAIVRNGFWIHDFEFADAFPGFSKGIQEQAEALYVLSEFSVSREARLPQPPSNGKVDLYTFQRMVYDLKTNAEKEVADFIDTQLGLMSGEAVEPPSDTQDSAYVILSNKDFDLDNNRGVIDDLAALKPNIDFGEGKKPRKRRRDRDAGIFSDRIVQLLEENNKILANYGYRFEDLQGQINEIRSERTTSTEMMREEMGALRDMIRDVLAGRVVNENDGAASGLANQAPITIVFEKNAHELSLAHRARLNKVVMDLQMDANIRAIITGFADRTGNPDFNAWISKERALSVKGYLEAQGIASDRLMLNFLGDVESQFANPADRKVEVVYVVNTARRN